MLEILAAALAATTAMTLFSYFVSASFRKLYEEPLLLEYVLTRFSIKLETQEKAAVAWSIHYLIGLAFVWMYCCVAPNYSWANALIFGSVIGIAGIVGWKIIFRLSGKPLQTDAGGYYLQLFIAHLIFAFTAIATYRLFNF